MVHNYPSILIVVDIQLPTAADQEQQEQVMAIVVLVDVVLVFAVQNTASRSSYE